MTIKVAGERNGQHTDHDEEELPRLESRLSPPSQDAHWVTALLPGHPV